MGNLELVVFQVYETPHGQALIGLAERWGKAKIKTRM